MLGKRDDLSLGGAASLIARRVLAEALAVGGRFNVLRRRVLRDARLDAIDREPVRGV